MGQFGVMQVDADSRALAAFPFGFEGYGTGMVLEGHDASEFQVRHRSHDAGCVETAGKIKCSPRCARKAIEDKLTEAFTIHIPGWDIPTKGKAKAGPNWAEV